MRRILPLLALLLLPLGTAAQPAPPATRLAETLLHIGETAEVTRAPDEVVASLRVEARAGSAQAAQDAVNRAMAAAVARIAARSGMTASTGAYWTNRVDEGRAWQAVQTLTLRSGEGATLLEMVGTLQGQGLAVAALEWKLTREATRAARQEASRLALDSLRARAEDVAGQLGLVLVGLREVRIDAPERGPRPAPMMAMAARAGGPAAAPPVAVAEDVVVAATVEAVAVLRPR